MPTYRGLTILLLHLAFLSQAIDIKSVSFSKVIDKFAQNGTNFFTNQVNLGTPSQELTVSFSTSTPYFWVPIKKCTAGEGKCGKLPANATNFDVQASTSASTPQASSQTYTLTLVDKTSQYTVAQSFTDDLMLNSQVTIKGFGFLGAESYNLALPASGIMGLAPVVTTTPEQKRAPPTILTTLMAQKNITNSTIGFSYRNSQTQLDFGETSESIEKWVPAANVDYSMSTTSLTFGGTTTNATQVVKFQSDFPFISIQKTFYDPLTDYIGREVPFSNVQTKNGLVQGDCDYSKVSKLQKLYLQIGNETLSQNITLHPTSFIKQYNGKCVYSSQKEDYWVFGMSFLEDYYVAFDFDKSWVGFRAYAGEGATTLTMGVASVLILIWSLVSSSD